LTDKSNTRKQLQQRASIQDNPDQKIAAKATKKKTKAPPAPTVQTPPVPNPEDKSQPFRLAYPILFYSILFFPELPRQPTLKQFLSPS
jgi:hypothetical protein